MKTPEEWAALTLVTESDQPHEWWPLAWVLRYRVASPLFPDTVKEVVTQERAFPAFNPWTRGKFKGDFPLEEVWHELWKTLDQFTREKLYPQALTCASLVLGMGRDVKPLEAWRAPFGPGVCWYYILERCIPLGQPPVWAAKTARLFTPSGIDPARFVFAETME